MFQNPSYGNRNTLCVISTSGAPRDGYKMNIFSVFPDGVSVSAFGYVGWGIFCIWQHWSCLLGIRRASPQHHWPWQSMVPCGGGVHTELISVVHWLFVSSTVQFDIICRWVCIWGKQVSGFACGIPREEACVIFRIDLERGANILFLLLFVTGYLGI